MKIRGGVRGAASAWLGLVILQAVVSQGGSGKIAGAFEVIDSLVRRAMDPNVPAIPDRSRPRSPSQRAGLPADKAEHKDPRPTAPAPARPLTPKEQGKTPLTLAPPR